MAPRDFSSMLGHRATAVRTRRAGRVAAVASVVLALLIIGSAIGAYSYMRADQRASEARYNELLGRMTGMDQPTRNALAAEFTDADKDLVADVPTDASKLIDPNEIVFSYVASDRNTAEMAATFKPFTDALSRAIGKPVRYQSFNDVDAEMNALHSGQLQLCAFNTGAVPNAVDAAGFVPVASLGGEAGSSTYTVKVIASTRTSINDVQGLRGHELTLTEPSSNSGYKAPLVLLKQKFNLRPGFDFGIRYSQGHSESIDGLVNGTFDVIAVASDVLAREEKSGQIKPDQYRVLYTSDPFPTACFGYAHNLKPEVAAKIRKTLADLKFAGADATAAYFAASDQTRLTKVDYAKDFALVRDIDDAIGYAHKLHTAASTTEPAATQP